MNILLLVALVFSSHSFGTDAYILCMSSKPPEGFILLVKESLYSKNQPEGFSAWGDEAQCKELAKQIESETSVNVINLASSGPYIPLFRSIGLMRIIETKSVDSLRQIGQNANLHSLMVIAPAHLNQFKDIFWYNNRLRSLSLKGVDKNSFVDVEQLPQFSELNFFAASNIEIRNAIALDRVPKLRTVSLVDVTVDQVPTFAHLQPNGVKELKNIKLIKEARTPSVNKTK